MRTAVALGIGAAVVVVGGGIAYAASRPAAAAVAAAGGGSSSSSSSANLPQGETASSKTSTGWTQAIEIQEGVSLVVLLSKAPLK